MSIHPHAYVHPEAKLGPDVEVGAFSYIGPHTEIGGGSRIGPNAVIHPYVRMGEACRVHAGAVIGDVPQDLGFTDQISYVEIGTQCVFREGVTVHRGTKEGTITRVGDRCYFMANSHVAHNCEVGNDVIFANGVLLGGYVKVGDRAFLSGNCVVHQFCHIGRLAMMSGLSAASKDVPPFCVLLNSATNRVAGLNVVGMRRAGLTPDERKQVKQAFKMLYHEGRNVEQAISAMKETFPDGPAAELWQFAENSPRGLCAPAARDMPSEDE